MKLLHRLRWPWFSSSISIADHAQGEEYRASSLILEGNTLEDRGDFSGALRCYDDAIKASPLLARAHLNRGNIFQAQNRLKDALAAYNKAVSLEPEYAGAHFNLGNVYMRLAQPFNAISAYQTALKFAPHHFETELALGMAYEASGRFEEALAGYRRAIESQADSIPALMGIAGSLRAMARNEEALEAINRVLSLSPHFAQAHCLAGDALLDLGQVERAIASYGRVLEIEPEFFVALTSMGDAQRLLGQHDAALMSYYQAASIHSDVALLHMKLGNTLQATGSSEAALKSMTRALALDPNSPVIHFNAGNLYEEQGIFSTAQAHYQRAVEILPEAQTFNNLGIVQRKLGHLDEALLSYRRALALDPKCVEAHCNLGLALQGVGQYESALSSLMQARAINPINALVHCNIAVVLLDLDRLQEALGSCQLALGLDSNMVEAHCNLGMVKLASGLLSEAADSFENALRISPDYTKARHNLSHAQLAMGQFAQGWGNYEHRIDEHRNSRVVTQLPQWSGQPTAPSDRILVFVEQGLGDMLQFSRYLPLVAERFPGGVSLYALTPLVSLFRRSFPMVTVLDAVPGDESAWQWQCPLLSLPLAFGTVLETIPSQTPYLVPDAGRSAYWQHRISQLHLPTGGHKKIGLVWKPGTGMKIAHLKATSLQTLSPLLNLSSCTWFSLQKEPDPEVETWVSAGKLIDWSADLHDFDDTAALAVNLDLVISVDTSVAHLAGGLGLPTWLLNRYASDWRWMREREDSPWYPTVKIFAQEVPGEWSTVARRVAEDLSKWQPLQLRNTKPQVSAAEDWRAQGNAWLQSGNLNEAAQCYRNGIRDNPSDTACCSNLGFALVQLGQRAEAEKVLGNVVANNPSDFDALYLLGNLARDAGAIAQSIAYYRSALKANPDFEYCRRALCMLLVQSGQMGEARLLMDERPPVDSESVDDHIFLGTMHLAFSEYVEAEAAFLCASQREPLNTTALANLGAAQLGKRDAVSAANTFGRLLALEPENAAAYSNRATAFQLSGQIELAIQDYRHALRVDPQYLYAQQNLLCAMTYSSRCTPQEYLREACNFGEKVRNLAKPYSSWTSQLQPLGARALRVGFVSGDLRRHPVGFFLESILKCLDRTNIVCIAYSNAVSEDAHSEQLRRAFFEWNRVATLTDQELAAKIHADDIDVLVDLAGHTAHNRLAVFAWRPAPVQVAWLGYWASTGVAEMDYVLVDEYSVSPAQTQHFSEKLWYLPSSRMCMSTPADGSAISSNRLPALRKGYVTFASFQNLGKISDASLSTWAGILALLPTARLRLQSHPLGYPETLGHMRTRLAEANIDLDRVDLFGGTPREEYLKAYWDVDIVLDTFPFPGGTTTAEALWMGVPTLTLAGHTLVARQGESMLRCVGLADWIATSEPDYVRLAVEKASDLAKLAQLRAGLRDAALQSVVFDAESFAKNLALAFSQLHTMGEAGQYG